MLEADLNPQPCSFMYTAHGKKKLKYELISCPGLFGAVPLGSSGSGGLRRRPLPVLNCNQNMQGKYRSQLDLSLKNQKQAKNSQCYFALLHNIGNL